MTEYNKILIQAKIQAYVTTSVLRLVVGVKAQSRISKSALIGYRSRMGWDAITRPPFSPSRERKRKLRSGVQPKRLRDDPSSRESGDIWNRDLNTGTCEMRTWLDELLLSWICLGVSEIPCCTDNISYAEININMYLTLF